MMSLADRESLERLVEEWSDLTAEERCELWWLLTPAECSVVTDAFGPERFGDVAVVT